MLFLGNLLISKKLLETILICFLSVVFLAPFYHSHDHSHTLLDVTHIFEYSHQDENNVLKDEPDVDTHHHYHLHLKKDSFQTNIVNNTIVNNNDYVLYTISPNLKLVHAYIKFSNFFNILKSLKFISYTFSGLSPPIS